MVLPKTASENDNNEAAAVKVNSNQEVNNETAKAKNANQKQEDTNKVENSSTNENVAENTSDSKKATSNSDVRVIKNDVTTDKKEVKNSEMVDNSKNMNTTTAEIHSLGVKVVGAQALEESKAETDNSLSTGMTAVEYEKIIEDKSNYYSYTDVANHVSRKVSRTVIMHKPTGDETISQFGSVRSVNGNSTIQGWPTEYRNDLRIATIINNNGNTTHKWVYQNNVNAESSDGGRTTFFKSAADKEAYEKFMAFAANPDIKVTLPAIDESQLEVPGYTYTVSPADSNLGDWTFDPLNANSVEIEVNYKKVATNTVTYKFEDPFNNPVGDSVSVSGKAGSDQPVNLTIPSGYQLVSGSLPTSVTIPDSDRTISIPVKHQLTITLSGESTFSYADDNWKNLVETNELPASGYNVGFNDANARVQLSDGDVTYNENRNAGTYTVSLTEKGLNDIKDQLGDNFIYPDLKDVTSKATFIIAKGNKEIDLMGGDMKVFDNTSTLPDQGTFYSGLGLGDDDQGKISIYNSDGTLKTIQLTPNDVEFWLNGKKVTKDQAKSVGTYDLRLTDAFIQKVKDADGNNGNNYEWTYGPEYETAQYKIYQATGKAKLSGDNSKLYDGNAVTTAEVNKDGKITVDLTLPVYKQADEPGDEPQLLRTVDLGKYTLQDGDYTWANGTAPTKGGIYTINLNKDKILAHLQDRLVDLAGMGTDPDDPTKSLSNVTISTDDMAGQATFAIETTTAYQFVDDDDNGSKVGTPVSKTGLNGESSAISLTVPTNYVLAPGQTLPTSVTFGDTNNTIDIHLKHATKTVDKNNVPDGYTKDDFAKEIKRSITAKEPTGDVDLSQKTELTRTGTYDEVTKKVVSYDNWTTGSFDEVTAPEVAGYIPSQASVAAVTGVTTDYVDPKVVITYAPNDQTGKISYVDVNTGTEVGVTSLTGKTDEDVTITPVAPTGWKIIDGQSIPKTEKATPNGIPTVTVKVEHKTTTVQPTDPKTPKDKLPDNPDKHYPDGVGEKDLNKTIVRQITVVKPDGTRENHDQSVKLTRTATVDEVTGKVTGYSDWTTSQFDEYDAPVVPGYTPSQAKVEGVKVTANSDFTPVTITYAPNAQQTTVTYVDENGNEIKDPDGSSISGSHYDVTGVTDQKNVPTNIKNNVPMNWHITDTTVPDVISFGAQGHPAITVHVAHNTKTVDKNNVPDGYHESDFSKTVTRTITAKEPTKNVDLSQHTEVTRTGTYDEVTKKVISFGDWTTSKFDKVNAPEVAGYTPSQAEVPAVDQVTVDYTDPKVEITYTPNEQTGKISYVDPNGKEVGTTPLTGKTDEEIPVTPNVPAGWQIVPGQDIPTTITATPDGIPTVTVKVEHKITTVTPTDPKTPSDKLPDNPGKNYPKGVDKKDLNKTVKRTITVKKPDGSTVDASQETTLTRTATVDEVTGQVTYGKWTTSKLDKYNAPEIPGYTPSQAEVPAVDQVTVDYTDPKIEITYTPNEQTGKITYVDPNGKEVGNTPLTGKTDEEIPVTPNVPAGWQVVPGQDIPTTITATPDGIPTVTVNVEHKIVPVTPTDPKTPSDKLPDNPGKNYPKGVGTTDLNKTITRKITVIKPDGTKEAHDQTVNLTRTATVDEVTGKVTGYSDWTTSSFAEYDAPEIPGYTPSGNAPAVALVTSTSDFTPIVITYIPTDQTVKYKFVDPQGKVVGVQTVPGKTGQTVPVNIHIPDGYQLVPGESVPTSYTFKDGNPDQIIKVALIPTNGGQPTTNDHQEQGTPATNTPTNTTLNGNDVTGKLEGNVPNVQTGKTATSQSTTANKDNQLPQTGNASEKNVQIFGALSAGLAALVAGFVPNRRRDNK